MNDTVVTVQLDESQRQAVLLALAHLAVERPGWDMMLSEIAVKMDTLENFKRRQVESMRHPNQPHVSNGKPVLYERFKIYAGHHTDTRSHDSGGSAAADTPGQCAG